eukprot:2947686-Amphidinium_carterae.1
MEQYLHCLTTQVSFQPRLSSPTVLPSLIRSCSAMHLDGQSSTLGGDVVAGRRTVDARSNRCRNRRVSNVDKGQGLPMQP